MIIFDSISLVGILLVKKHNHYYSKNHKLFQIILIFKQYIYLTVAIIVENVL